MVTKKAVRRFLPEGAKNLSMGKEFCAFMDKDGNIVTLYYSELFSR